MAYVRPALEMLDVIDDISNHRVLVNHDEKVDRKENNIKEE